MTGRYQQIPKLTEQKPGKHPLPVGNMLHVIHQNICNFCGNITVNYDDDIFKINISRSQFSSADVSIDRQIMADFSRVQQMRAESLIS